MQQHHNEDDDDFNYSDIENTADEEEEENDTDNVENTESTILMNMMESYDWAAALSHITHNPASVYTVRGMQRRTPLHLACHHDAPAVVIQALLQQHPAASVATGTSSMNPLHITCSSPHASAHVVRVLQEWGRTEQFSMRDIDGAYGILCEHSAETWKEGLDRVPLTFYFLSLQATLPCTPPAVVVPVSPSCRSCSGPTPRP